MRARRRDHLVGFERLKASGMLATVSGAVSEVLGRPALAPAQALERYRGALAQG